MVPTMFVHFVIFDMKINDGGKENNSYDYADEAGGDDDWCGQCCVCAQARRKQYCIEMLPL